MESRQFEFQEELKKIGMPVDKEEWHMTPLTGNAYYNPLGNEIVFPAGILQPPFFYLDADDAVNDRAIGVVIGHEMTHGFDDKGRSFDKNGNMIDWWTKEDVHSLGRWRVNGPLPNTAAFHEAFSIKQGDPMYLPAEKRAIIC